MVIKFGFTLQGAIFYVVFTLSVGVISLAFIKNWIKNQENMLNKSGLNDIKNKQIMDIL